MIATWASSPDAARILTDKVARFDTLRREHIAKLDEIIRCERLGFDLVTGPLARRARAYRQRLVAVHNVPEAHSPVSGYGPLGDWGRGGLGPTIDDMLASARFAVRAASVRELAA